MYVRPPGNRAGEVRIPENYSGNRFSRQSPYSDMPPPIRTHMQKHDQTYIDIPPDEEFREEIPLQAPKEREIETAEEAQRAEETSRAVGSSIFSSLLPKGNISSHFPFGHGLGSEELLILAVMLLVFLSGNECGEVDGEFLLLLGLLLFAG